MPVGHLSSAALEVQANLACRKIVGDFEQLGQNLQPHQLYQEVLEGAGLNRMSVGKAVDYAAQRHPIATVVGAAAIGYFGYSVVAKPGGRAKIAGIGTAFADTARTLTEAATDVFRQRAADHKRALMERAQTHLEAGATGFADRVENRIDDVAGRFSDSPALKPLLVAGLQILIVAVADGLLGARTRK